MIMKLKQITFTGLDEKTDVNELKIIQKAFPFVEFGVLMSKNWQTNGNRYPDPEIISRFTDQGLNLSAHLCGRIAREAYTGNFTNVIETYPIFTHPDFKRTQLNVAPYENIFETAETIEEPINKEIIIQQRSPSIKDTHAFIRFELKNPDANVTMLIDPSGGRGVDDGLDIIATDHKTGYAGGINANNVEDKLRFLMEMETVGDFWIDMESGVRTDDWFDINKVMDVIEKCKGVLKKY